MKASVYPSLPAAAMVASAQCSRVTIRRRKHATSLGTTTATPHNTKTATNTTHSLKVQDACNQDISQHMALAQGTCHTQNSKTRARCRAPAARGAAKLKQERAPDMESRAPATKTSARLKRGAGHLPQEQQQNSGHIATEAAQHLTNSCGYQLQPLGLHTYKQRTQQCFWL
jgi:hypothetical protein